MSEMGQARFVGGPADGEAMEVAVEHGSPATMRVMRHRDSPSPAWHTYLLADTVQEAGLWTYHYVQRCGLKKPQVAQMPPAETWH